MNIDKELLQINIELAKNPTCQHLKTIKATLLNNKALGLFNKNKGNEALKLINQAIELAQTSALFSSKSNVLFKMNKYDESMECANKALELDPENPKAKDMVVINLNNKQMVECEKGNFDEALKLLSKAIQLKPEDKSLVCNKALILSYLERYDEAIVEVDKCLVMDESFYNAKVVKAAIVHKLSLNDFEKDDYEAALEKINQAIELKNNEATYLINKSSCLIKLKRYEEAIEFADKALALEKTNKDAAHLRFIANDHIIKASRAKLVSN